MALDWLGVAVFVPAFVGAIEAGRSVAREAGRPARGRAASYLALLPIALAVLFLPPRAGGSVAIVSLVVVPWVEVALPRRPIVSAR